MFFWGNKAFNIPLDPKSMGLMGVRCLGKKTLGLETKQIFRCFPYAAISCWNMLNIQNIELSFGMQPSIDCLLGNLAADLIQEHIYNSNGD